MDDSGNGRRDFGVDFVGGNFDKGFVNSDSVADGLQPAGHGSLGDGFTECGECDITHDSVISFFALERVKRLIGDGHERFAQSLVLGGVRVE